MVALQRVIRRVRSGEDWLVNTLSDYRSSLEVLTGPKTYPLLTHEYRRDISVIVVEGRAVRLFELEHYVGIAGNECAQELARRAALTRKTAADYDRFSMSYAKRTIRAATLEEWQERYTEESTGEHQKTVKNVLRPCNANSAKMRVCGLFAVDAALPLRLTGLTTTYCIVLLQFAFL
ncbi:hypothetical protein EVAR_44982_1 [Eumeta japonica]|uniref:Uncharacterized protein n=1 Tax=Eumeta variegata TaxID=151549 RepID=A0A4C1XDJ1_EUMVA|nr:hypothetical protein EVAR_44982_1 [Eumeta japonica]